MKNISKILLAFVLGILVSFTLNVAAQVVLSSDAVSYSNSRTSEITVDGALDELFSAVDINEKIGNMEEISSLGNGTIVSAINAVNNSITTTSHVGMIVQSTTLDTMEKVIAIYGGTTWVKIEGRFLLGESDEYTINSIGGEATHTLTVTEMPSHNHTIEAWSDKGVPAGSTLHGIADYNSTNWYNYNYIGNNIGNTGGNQPHNNMPPYKVVYIWERTA